MRDVLYDNRSIVSVCLAYVRYSMMDTTTVATSEDINQLMNNNQPIFSDEDAQIANANLPPSISSLKGSTVPWLC